MQENILCITRARFEQLGIGHGFEPRTGRAELERLLRETEFQPRGEALENDVGFKQLIPYVVFSHTEIADAPRKFFAYRRSPKGGESRLHGKRSLGVGGHIKVEDGVDANVAYVRAFEREICEEVHINKSGWSSEFIGVLNDDLGEAVDGKVPVGQVHLGIVSLVSLINDGVSAKEDELVDTGFFTIEELLADIDNFESWSQLLIQHFAALPQPV